MESLALFAPYIAVVVLATAVFFVPYARNVGDSVVTLFHELGHNVVIIPFFPWGGAPRSIKITNVGAGGESMVSVPPASVTGDALWFMPIRRLIAFSARLINLFAGYMTPIYGGLALAVMAYLGEWQVGGAVLIGVGILSALLIRNLVAFIVVAIYTFTAVAFISTGSESLTLQLLAFTATLLMVGGVKDLIMITFRLIRNEVNGFSDFHFLSQELLWGKLPAIGWLILFYAVQVLLCLTAVPSLLGVVTS